MTQQRKAVLLHVIGVLMNIKKRNSAPNSDEVSLSCSYKDFNDCDRAIAALDKLINDYAEDTSMDVSPSEIIEIIKRFMPEYEHSDVAASNIFQALQGYGFLNKDENLVLHKPPNPDAKMINTITDKVMDRCEKLNINTWELPANTFVQWAIEEYRMIIMGKTND